jgi:hypothetical protein
VACELEADAAAEERALLKHLVRPEAVATARTPWHAGTVTSQDDSFWPIERVRLGSRVLTVRIRFIVCARRGLQASFEEMGGMSTAKTAQVQSPSGLPPLVG